MSWRTGRATRPTDRIPAAALATQHPGAADPLDAVGAAKGRYLHTVTITTSMNPGVKVDPGATASAAAVEPAEAVA